MDIVNAIKALYLFKRYTYMPRLLEILFSILAWILLIETTAIIWN